MMRAPARFSPIVFIVLATILAAPAVQAAAAGPTKDTPATHLPSNEDLRHIRSMQNPRLSPDGRRVLLEVSDATVDGARSHLWLVSVDNTSTRQITYSPDSDKSGEHSAQWMPDGKSLLFLAKRGDITQLFRLPVDGGEALAYDLKVLPLIDPSVSEDALPPRKAGEAATEPEPLPLEIEDFQMAPSGKWVAVIGTDPETPGEKKQKEQKADAVLHQRDPHAKRLYLFDPESGAVVRTAVEPDVNSVAWARAGDRLLAITKGPNDATDLAPAMRAWIVSLADPQHPKHIVEAPNSMVGGAWSNDGKTLYFQARAQEDAPPIPGALYALTLANGSLRTLSHDLVGALDGPLIPVDQGVLQLVHAGVRGHYLRFSEHGPEPVDDYGLPVTDLNTNFQRSGWVWFAGDASGPAALKYAPNLTAAPRKLNTPALVPEGTVFPAARVLHWTSDTFTIEGLLYLPEVEPGHRVPLLVDVHGGPSLAWLDDFDPVVGYLVGQGWAVLRPNPRGSTGYGTRFVAANKNDLGGGDFRDIMAGVDHVIAHFPVDPDRMALYGYSYGGEMAGFAEGKTDRFKAIVSGAPVINQYSEYGTEGETGYDRWFYGRPWEHPEDAWRQSPLAYVSKAKTPFLLLQGQNDTTDPPGQSLEMYRALRQLGVPVELVEYPRENHMPLYYAIHGFPSPEPWHGFDARQRIVKFIRSQFDAQKRER